MKWILGVMLALGLGGCNQLDYTLVRGSGPVIEQHHGLGQQVTRVEAAVPASIHLKAGEQRGIVIRGQEDLLPYLVLTERDDTLEMKVRDGYRFELSEPIDIDITLPRVEALALAGLARGDLSGFKGNELVLSVAGLGDIVADRLEVNRLEGNVAGAGSLALGQGSAREIELNVAGAGGVSGEGFEGREVEVNIAGSGDVKVRASGQLKIGIAGAGSVGYWGDPALTSEIAGSGRVSRLGG